MAKLFYNGVEIVLLAKYLCKIPYEWREYKMTRSVHDEIADSIAKMPVINHHEEAWKSFSIDFGEEYDLPHFLFNNYLGGDLASSGYGFGSDLVDYLGTPTLPAETEEAWSAMRPYLDNVRSTSYFRYILKSLKDLFDITEDDLFSEQWRSASEHIAA